MAPKPESKGEARRQGYWQRPGFGPRKSVGEGRRTANTLSASARCPGNSGKGGSAKKNLVNMKSFCIFRWGRLSKGLRPRCPRTELLELKGGDKDCRRSAKETLQTLRFPRPQGPNVAKGGTASGQKGGERRSQRKSRGSRGVIYRFIC